MKESYIEGLATHDGPESCGGIREGAVEALTGVSAGEAIEPRNQPHQGADAVNRSGRQHGAGQESESRTGPARSQNLSMHGHSMRENRESFTPPTENGAVGRTGKANGRTPVMEREKQSDRSIVPAKPPNKARTSAAEVVEGRGLAKGTTDGQNTPRTQRRTSVPSALDRVRLERHPWPNKRFGRRNPRQEPSALAAPAGIRAGGGSNLHR